MSIDDENSVRYEMTIKPHNIILCFISNKNIVNVPFLSSLNTVGKNTREKMSY